MTTFTEGRRAAGFIISEANGSLSRDNGIVKAGEVLQAGEIVALDGSELVAWTDGDAAGIMLYPVNASSQAMPGAYLARQAEVNAELLIYPDDVEEADALAALAERGIIAHAANIGAGGGGGDLPEWVPDGAVVFSDFAAGNHWAGNAVVSLGDLWEENLDWSVWNPALVTASGITADPTDSAPTMVRTYSAPILAGDLYFCITSHIDADGRFELAASELPGGNGLLHREIDPRSTTDTASCRVEDFADLSETISPPPPLAYPHLAAVMAVTSETVRLAMNYSTIREYSVDTVGGALTDICLGIVGSDGSTLLTATFYSGVPSDETMRTLSLVGVPAAPSNVTPPEILDVTTDAVLLNPGVWGGNPLPSDTFDYQWFADGVEIPGETNTYYTYQPGDTGKSIKVRETATSVVGSASIDSNTITAP